jgi:hypothetical protein
MSSSSSTLRSLALIVSVLSLVKSNIVGGQRKKAGARSSKRRMPDWIERGNF